MKNNKYNNDNINKIINKKEFYVVAVSVKGRNSKQELRRRHNSKE